MIGTRARKALTPVLTPLLQHLPLHPNIVTILSLFPAILSYLFFAVGNFPLGGFFLLVAGLFDMLDGVLARARGLTTRQGSYMDAMIDRIVEVLALIGIGLGSGLWEQVSIALALSLLIPYAKARAAMEVEVDNFNWPDLFERAERVFYLGIIIPISHFMGLLPHALFVFNVLCLVTLLQRIQRALGVIS